MLDQGRDDRDVGIEFDLTRKIEDDEVLLRYWIELFREELKVLEEES